MLLLIAAEKGYKEVVKLLLSREDVELNSLDYKGWTLLSRAAVKEYKGIVKLLLS